MSFSPCKRVVLFDDCSEPFIPTFNNYNFSEPWCYSTDSLNLLMKIFDQYGPMNMKIFCPEQSLFTMVATTMSEPQTLVKIFDAKRVYRVFVYCRDPNEIPNSPRLVNIDPRLLDFIYESNVMLYLCDEGIRYYHEKLGSPSTVPGVHNPYLADVMILEKIRTTAINELKMAALALQEQHGEQQGVQPN